MYIYTCVCVLKQIYEHGYNILYTAYESNQRDDEYL